MYLSFLLRGLIIGFSIAAPVGPIGVLCIRRTLAEGRVRGVVCGLGAASADALYGCVAAFGLTLISDALVSQQEWLRSAGGVFLCCLGIKTLLTKPAQQPPSAAAGRLLGAYASTFFLTLTNPMTILSFAAVFAGLGLAGTGGDYGAAGTVVLGVFTGSALWWLLLSGAVSLLHQRFTPAGLQWGNRIAGAVITVFGLLALSSALW